MTTVEIVAELPRPSPKNHAEILEQLWRLDDLPLHPAEIAATGIISADIDGREAHRAHLTARQT